MNIKKEIVIFAHTQNEKFTVYCPGYDNFSTRFEAEAELGAMIFQVQYVEEFGVILPIVNR